MMITKEWLQEMLDNDVLQKDMADMAGVNRRTVWRHMKKYGLECKARTPDNTGMKHRQATKDKIRKSQTGTNNSNYNGGRSTQDGYIIINVGNNVWKLEHRLVMEQHLGRELSTEEHVHHKDEITTNNNIDNLEVMTNSEHTTLHNNKQLAVDADRKYFGINQHKKGG